MKNQTINANANANVNAASNNQDKTANAASSNQNKPALSYVGRVKVAKEDLTSLSRLFKSVKDVYGDVVKGIDFREFKSYIKSRFNIAEDDNVTTPKRGWGSAFHYAVQFAERYAKYASLDKTSAAHSAAVAYLRSARAEKQGAMVYKF